MLRKKIILVFFLIIGMSFVSQTDTAQAASKKDAAAIKKLVISAYKSFKKEVDLSEYDLNYTNDKEMMTQVMTEIVTQTPGLFYSGSTYQTAFSPDTKQVKRIVLSYDKAYLANDGSVNITKIKNTQKKIDSEVNLALKSVNSKMSKLEKALVLHDYLIQSISYYDNKSVSNRMTEEGAFLKKKANCTGYALAYAILMERIGVPVKYVSSEKMVHIWNMIKLGGKWYHVDVTWDDPVEVDTKEDQYGLVNHDYFLCSTKKMKKEEHYGFTDTSATNTKYDNSWWKNVSSKIHYKNGKWIYINQKGIVSRNSLTSGSTKILRALSGKSMVKFNSNMYYLITQNSVYLYDYSKNTLKKVWSPKKKYGSSYSLTQIKYQDGKIYYRVLKGKTYKKGSIKVKINGLV